MNPAPLLERQRELDAMQALLEAASQRGAVALVAGEAGIGKSSLLRAAAAAHADRGGIVWWGACDALQTPHPLAPLMDIAREARPRFAERLDGPRAALFEAVLDELRRPAVPLLMVVEDAHWADDATLDLLKYLGRRIERTRCLLAVSYRDDEVTLTHPLRPVLGEMPTSQTTRLELAGLTPAAVDTLARAAGRPAEGVHEVTHGNAFFVTELLRDRTGRSVPSTVQDVLLARFARLPERVQELLRAVAVVPGRAERWLVDALQAPTLGELEAALASGLLVAEGDYLAYRHELGRVAVESALSAPARQHLHARMLALLEEPARGTAPARLVHHAVHANDVAAISRHGPRAADQARARDAAREAVAHWDTTLRRGRPADGAEEERWLEAAFLAFVRAGRIEGREAICSRLEALARERGDLARAASNISRRSGVWVARNDHARALAISAEAMAIVEPLPASERKVMVWMQEAWLLMLDRDCAESLDSAGRALAMAEALGLADTQWALRHLIACDRLLLEGEPGIRAMQALADEHLRAGRRAEAASVLSNLGSGAGEVMRFDAAEPALRETLAIAQALEMDGQADYARAWLALCRLHQGDWSEAGALAMAVCARSAAAEMSRIMALVALGRLRVRRGDPGAMEALDEALRLVGEPGTLQRLAPVRAARAEAAFARGDRAGVAAEVAAALPLAAAKGHPWFIGELAYWGWRAGAIAQPPEGCAEPYALEMTGRWREAAAAWQALDCPYEQARSLAKGDAEAQQQALALFDRLGAAPAAEALRRRLREAGVRGVARGARESTRAHPCGLTTAEMKVLRLMGEGLRNAEIAARVHRSVRTVDHHVAAVLAKLGVDSRQEAVRRAEREGWLAPAGQSGQSGGAN